MMNHKELILDYFYNSETNIKNRLPIFLPDLTTWYNFHHKNDSLPSEFKGKPLEDICRFLNIPIWNTCKPWRIDSKEVEVSIKADQKEIIKTFKYQHKILTAKWIKGPDGDWWQTEYPVKNADDLKMMESYLKGRTFHMEFDAMIELEKRVNSDGIVIPLLPTRAFSWLMLEILGWTDGLMLLLDEEELIEGLVENCEFQIQQFSQRLIKSLNERGFQIFLSPDNLDGMFISPDHFDQYLKKGYEKISRICRENNSKLIVHGGGPLNRIIKPLTETGVDCISGVSGPPQGDTPIESIRNSIGNETILLGGIPQDYLMDSAENDIFISRLERIIDSCKMDTRSIIGIADHVPLEADMSKLKKIAELVYSA